MRLTAVVVRALRLAVQALRLKSLRHFSTVNTGEGSRCYEGNLAVTFDDRITTDTAAEKTQDMAEIGITTQPCGNVAAVLKR